MANGFEKKEDINGLKKSLKFLNNNNNDTHFKEEYFPKRPALDLTFKNVRYTVSAWHKLSSGEFTRLPVFV